MPAGSRSHARAELDTDLRQYPPISACESGPGTTVFLESGNTDGWIASDLTVDLVD